MPNKRGNRFQPYTPSFPFPKLTPIKGSRKPNPGL